MNNENVSAILLAGGKSRRMGQNKSYLKLRGRTLLEIQADKLKDLGIKDIMLSGCDEVLEGTIPVEDIHKGMGPLGGIHACLLKAKNPACLVISVDIPLVSTDTLKKLIEAHEGSVTALFFNSEIEPLIAVYDKSLVEELDRLLCSGILSVKKVLAEIPVKRVPYTEAPVLLTNCNTPGDFETVKEYINNNETYSYIR